MADYPGALDCFVDESRVFIGQNSHRALVLHCTGSPDPSQTAQELGAYFNTTPLMTSVHYGIDRQGVLCQYVLEADGAGGNCCTETDYDPFWDQFPGNKNLWTISIECVNDITNSLALTAAQQTTLFPLVAYLIKKHQIPVANIKGHFSLEPINRAECPGPEFPWPALIAYLEGAPPMNIPKGWTDNGTILLSQKKDIPITQGFRDWILSHTWDPANIPLRAAESRNPLERSNPGLGSGTRQVFLFGNVLEWTPAKGVFQAWAGQELLTVEHALSAALAKAN